MTAPVVVDRDALRQGFDKAARYQVMPGPRNEIVDRLIASGTVTTLADALRSLAEDGRRPITLRYAASCLHEELLSEAGA